MAVIDRDVVMLGEGLAGSEIVDGAVVDREGPADGATITGVDIAAIQREGAHRRSVAGLLQEAGGVGVGGIDIAEGDSAGGGVSDVVGLIGGEVGPFGGR